MRGFRVRLTKRLARALVLLVAVLSALLVAVLLLPHWLSRSSYQKINGFDDYGYIVTDIQIRECSIFSLSGCMMGDDWFLVDKHLNYNTRGRKLYRGLWREMLFVEKKKVDQLEKDAEVIGKFEILQAGIWSISYVKYDSSTPENYVYNIDLLFGLDAVDPRPNWNLTKIPLQQITSDLPTYMTVKRKTPAPLLLPEIDLTVRASKKSSYKILQVADLHFGTGEGTCRDQYPEVEDCKADKRTLTFLNRVLDLDNPDLVVLTGDQIFGEDSFDSITTTLKFLKPLIDREIPYALMFGNHDDEGSMSREQLMSFLQTLPYSLAKSGPDEIEGVGNYYFQVTDEETNESALSFFVLDSHKYSQHPKVLPGYDWIKEDQLEYIKELDKSLKYGRNDLKFAFFHIPLPEFKNLQQGYTGNYKEGITAPRYNTFARQVLQEIGVSVISVGHDHCNDYCLLDSKVGEDNNKIWLCYGGAVGEGGYGGYGGTTRRLRTFEVDLSSRSIKSYKRLETAPDQIFDEQTLVANGKPVSQ
jgi:3',5'-cyclic AMP phosphodiesterase CpdA